MVAARSLASCSSISATTTWAPAAADAAVVKVESAAGDPLREWGSGGLFEFLNTSKKSVDESEFERLVDDADVLIVDGAVDVDALRTAHPALVVVTITPFGCDGPWV